MPRAPPQDRLFTIQATFYELNRESEENLEYIVNNLDIENTATIDVVNRDFEGHVEAEKFHAVFTKLNRESETNNRKTLGNVEDDVIVEDIEMVKLETSVPSRKSETPGNIEDEIRR